MLILHIQKLLEMERKFPTLMFHYASFIFSASAHLNANSFQFPFFQLLFSCNSLYGEEIALG